MKLVELLEKSQGTQLPTTSVGMALGNLQTTIPDTEPPIKAESSDWTTFTDPERISRTFNFDKSNHLKYFITELLSYQEKVQHHAKITIEHGSVSVETYTHDINSVTQQDISLAKFCDEIYDDVTFLDWSRR